MRMSRDVMKIEMIPPERRTKEQRHLLELYDQEAKMFQDERREMMLKNTQTKELEED